MSTPEHRSFSFRDLILQTLPEFFCLQIAGLLILALPSALLKRGIAVIIASTGIPLSAFNLIPALFNWRIVVLAALGIPLGIAYAAVEIFSLIFLCSSILRGGSDGVSQSLKKGVHAVWRFLTPAGILILLYMIAAVPFTGVGLPVSLLESLSLPNYLISDIFDSRSYAFIYLTAMAVLILTGYFFVFSVHAVLLDDDSPGTALRKSLKLLRENSRSFLLNMVMRFVMVFVIQSAAFLILKLLPGYLLEHLQYNGSAWYRVISAFAVFAGAGLQAAIVILTRSYLMLTLTRYYLEYTDACPDVWQPRPRWNQSWLLKGVPAVFVIVITAASLICGLFYDQIFVREEPVKIVGHRSGGILAQENSPEGIRKAIEYECDASEFDVQRTKDGYYVVCHDKTFKRLTGVAKAPHEMTLEEIRQLKLKGTDTPLSAATYEEMLKAADQKIHLLVEMKGISTDRQMADDLIRTAKELGCLDQISIISYNIEVIEYVETTYPEIETGILVNLIVGDAVHLNCDMIILEELLATEAQIRRIHDSGKKAYVWTVNKKQSMERFLSGLNDAVITDNIPLMKSVQKHMNSRSDYRMILDRFEGFWDPSG
ncbi:MAG: glycerophosphoryl diester phosphodiesterase membrane domain-containing protein [Solobacterium sp.]|nr:glycerophosphoryl diester phosphodiesterase membrane domain-containing protein [Solobacterium sp.]